jgi:diguanylate cyclase (GGDEF)-like protein/PAS domain S-box-containing protein
LAEDEHTDAEELAQLIKRLDRHRRARMATDAISDQATGSLYDKQEHLRLLQAVAVAANESMSLDDALLSAVDEVCTHLHWPVGHAYLTITKVLALSDIWYVADLQRFGEFRKGVESTPLGPGQGLGIKAAADRAPIWASDLATVLPSRVANAAAGAGLRSALAVPIVGDEGAVAVLEFFAEDDTAPDPMLIEVMAKIGDLLGKVHLRTKREATLRTSEEQYRILFEGNPHPMWIHDADSLELMAVNDAAVDHYGYTREELLSMTLADLVPEEDRASERLAEALGRIRLRARDGEIIHAELSSYEIRLPGRRGHLTMAVDTNAALRIEEALRESERRFREMLDTIELLAVLLDVVGTITYCNPYVLRVTGYRKGDVIGKNYFELFVPQERRAQLGRAFLENIGRGIIAAHDEMEVVTRDGERRVILWNNTILRGPENSIVGAAAIGSDVTERRQAESQLLHNAFHDALTGLPNRALFFDRVGHALSHLKRPGRHTFAVLLLDIDDFKNVNDSLGHAAGDQLLIGIGERLVHCMRASDTVARFGGDEFTILMEGVTGPADVTHAVSRIHQEIELPFNIDGHEIFATGSIGVTFAAAEYEQPEQIVRDADTAMYRAKAQGRGRSEIFDAEMRAEAVARLQVETDLRRGIDRNELWLMYQPIVNLDSGVVVGFEALVRWRHPSRGIVAPLQFIPLAEETGLIVPIGEFVLRQACKQAARWRAHPHGASMHVSVNISSRQFSLGDLVATVRSALEEASLDPRALHLELTESVIIQNAESTYGIIEQIRALGCSIAVDDFGTGYSSLSYLHRFAVDQLKIDSSFVQSAADQRKSAEIIRSIVNLGRTLEIEVVAEGIETSQQADHLRELRCVLGQGYLFSRPVDPDVAMNIVERQA